MLAVTAYPILYAIYLSFFRADLRTPDANEFIWFGNYVTVLSSPIWWQAFGVTMLITVVSVAFELVLGMVLAIVMHRTIVGRGLVRTSALVPYAIVTVVAAFSWRFAWTQGHRLAGRATRAPLTEKWPSLAIIILAEVWKTVPFMALLLMAGLALVPEDLLKAASMDGASPWQRFWKITVPLIKPSILVALLFRTLDAFRVFDNIYVLTSGANDTSSVSIVAYNNLIRGLNLGIGSTMAVLIFITIAIIAFIFVKLFGAAAPGEERRPMSAQTETTGKKVSWAAVNVIVLLYAFIPVVWIISLSLKGGDTLNDGKFLPGNPTTEAYTTIFKNDDFLRALINSIGICLISTFVALVLGTMAAYAIARLDFPGKQPIVAMSLLISMFPQIALVTPLFKIETSDRDLRHLARPDHALHHLRAAAGIYTLSAFFREIPWELEKAAKMDGATPYQAFRKVIAPLAMPGVFTTAILVFIACWNDFLFAISLTSTNRARTVPAAMSYFTGATTFEKPDGRDRGGRGRHHHPHRHLRPVLPAPHRRWPHIGSGQGLTPSTHREGAPRGRNRFGPRRQALSRRGTGSRRLQPGASPTASSSSWSGPSGCGKSTLLNMVAGLEDITKGELSIDGTVVNDKAPKDRDIAMVFQSYALYPHMTVGENMAFPLVLAGVDKATIKSQGRRGRGDAGADRAPRPQAGQPLRWPAAAGRDGPRDRAQPQGVPDGRAAVEPRRQAARADADPGRADPEDAGHHDALRHPRPDRGDDAR